MDEYDVSLQDGQQLEEIDLLAELMLLASAALTLTQAQIDAVLGSSRLAGRTDRLICLRAVSWARLPHLMPTLDQPSAQAP